MRKKKLPTSGSLHKFTASFLGVLLTALATAAHAEENRLFAYIENNGVRSVYETITSNTSSISYDSRSFAGSPGNTYIAGVADFGVLRAQARASASGLSNTTRATMGAQTRFTAFVNAATPSAGSGPGLNFGDSVSLNLSFRLDGILNSGAAASGDNSGGTRMRANLRIVDPSIQLYCDSPDGCYTPRLVDFSASALSQSYGNWDNITDNTYNSWRWDLTTKNALDELLDIRSDSNSWTDPNNLYTCGPGPCNDINFDTGILSTTIETTIGAELDIFADLVLSGTADTASTVANIGNSAFGSADFFNTYGLLLTPVTEGVELAYNITPASVVPVPPAAWLFVSGIIGLVGIARRK